MTTEASPASSTLRYHARRTLITVSITIAFILFLILAWHASDIFFLIFAAVLWAILLRSVSRFVENRSHLKSKHALALVTLAFVLSAFVGFWLIGAQIVSQMSQLISDLPQALNQLKNTVSQTVEGQWIISEVSRFPVSPQGQGDMFHKATGMVSNALWGLTALFIIFVVGIYFAGNSKTYVNGLLRLVPLGRRPRVGEVLSNIDSSLRWWLMGRIASMLIVGILATLGLWALGVPLALALGILAALLDFIPNFGPILAAAPAILFAWIQDPMMAVYVALLYVGIQTAEAYLLTPLIEERTVCIPPALVITFQLLLGTLAGLWGMALASPFLVLVFVLVRRFYVEDVLGDNLSEKTN